MVYLASEREIVLTEFWSQENEMEEKKLKKNYIRSV
jgi:hypothetical protein